MTVPACAIEVTRLTKVFPGTLRGGEVRAVDRIDLRVERGTIFGLLGPNGAGKTTTIRMLCGIITPTSGEASVLGIPVREDPRAVRQRLGAILEEEGIYERLTAHEYLRYFGRLYGLSRKDVRRRTDELMDALRLADRSKERLGGFSKGMKQKVRLARALIHRPDVLLLDEPTSGLDPEVAESVREMLARASRDRGATVVLCSHDLDEVQRFCSRVAIIAAGRIRMEDDVARLTDLHGGGGLARFRLRLAAPAAQYAAMVAAAEGVRRVEPGGDGELCIEVAEPETTNPRLLRGLLDAGAPVVALAQESRSLREAYLETIRSEAPGP